MWVWLNAINKLKSYLQSGSADMCVRSHVIAIALSLGVPGKPCQLLTVLSLLRVATFSLLATLRSSLSLALRVLSYLFRLRLAVSIIYI